MDFNTWGPMRPEIEHLGFQNAEFATWDSCHSQIAQNDKCHKLQVKLVFADTIACGPSPES